MPSLVGCAAWQSDGNVDWCECREGPWCANCGHCTACGKYGFSLSGPRMKCVGCGKDLTSLTMPNAPGVAINVKTNGRFCSQGCLDKWDIAYETRSLLAYQRLEEKQILTRALEAKL